MRLPLLFAVVVVLPALVRHLAEGVPLGHQGGYSYPDEVQPLEPTSGSLVQTQESNNKPAVKGDDLGESRDTWDYHGQREREMKVLGRGPLISSRGYDFTGKKLLNKWDYGTGDNGPEHWGKFSTTCSHGQQQSPVDLGKKVTNGQTAHPIHI